jgi:DNA-binding NtrC family response regulator
VAPKACILFVDDEPPVLAALARQLRRDRSRWEMVFAVGGQRGIDEIRNRCFTVVVSDFRMPDVDGIKVLTEAAVACPGVVLIMLSGAAEAEAMSRAVPSLHELIFKPCDTATLRAAIERAVEAAVVSA